MTPNFASAQFYRDFIQLANSSKFDKTKFISRRLCFFWLFLLTAISGWANIPGGGTGIGPAVTLVNNGNGTVTMANGITTIVITTNNANINQIYYAYNNSGALVTNQLLTGGTDGGELYWTGNNPSFGNMNFNYSVVTNSTNYIEIALNSTTANTGIMEVHYSMLRGSSGFYTTAILTHRSQDTNIYITLRPNIYAGAQFNWMSVDTNRNRLMEVSGGSSIVVQGAPKECYLWTNGIYAGQYEDKYKYSADLDSLPAWGWSSVGAGGGNIGIWNVTASPEYYPGGPMERSLMEHIGTTILNVFTGGYYGFSTDATIANGETWSKVYGPYFYYFNNITNTITATNLAAQTLYADALAQGAAEQTAWPYAWFNNANYTPASGRGAVQGKLTIADSGNPNASAANLWVGVVQQPNTSYDFIYDFQQWARPYQFWVKTDTNGKFTIPNVIAGTNYTLYAFGPGTPDTFMSQAQMGGSPPLIVDYPTNQFAVTVTAGATNNLGTNFWSPTRVGATVFEIGYPDRTASKFKHGDDYWVGDIGPTTTAPSPVWSKWLEYPFDFPNGVNYVVGQNRWSTDWNFIQPTTTDSQGNYNSSSSTITFNLAAAPTNGATASLYLGFCSDYYSAIIVSVNSVNAASLNGLSAGPDTAVPSTGYGVAYSSSDSNIREGNNGAFTDERLTFSAAALHAGANTISISFRQTGVSTPPGYFADHFMYDYLRLELTGYVPPPPASVAAYAGNNCSLVCWPVTPGATSYNLLRSTNSSGGYVSITNGVTGPVCGSGYNNAVYLDTNVFNGATYYYVVQSINPTGGSANSPPSSGASPSAGISTSAPATPMGLVVGSSGHQSVTLNWNAVSGANFYSVWRSTLMNNGGGASNVLSTIILNNNVTNTSYTDVTPTDGSIYTYFVNATAAGGVSANSPLVAARPLPATPAYAPISLTAGFVATTNITLNWTGVPGAVGYAIYRATSSGGLFTYLQTVTETTYTDIGLNPALIYYYRVAAVNAGGVSANATDLVNSQQVFPASLTAVGTNDQVFLTWPAATGAASYNLKRGISSGNETATVVTGYAGISYTNVGLVNGTTYYYVVTATGTGGTSGNSPEASATPFATSSGIWTAPASGNWSAATNWSGGGIATGSGSTANFGSLALPANLTVTLDSARTISGLIFGDTATTYDWTLAGTNILTLGTTPIINVVNQSATISTPLAGTAGLGKIGLGALTLAASNSVTGGVTVNAGLLTLDFTASNAPAANLIPANALTLGGGTLQVNGSSNAVSSQTFASTTLNAGASVISAAPAAGSGNPTVALGAFTANTGGVVEFTGSTTIGAGNVNVAANASITTTAGGNSAFVSGGAYFATAGLYDFAATTGAAPPYTVVGGSQISGFYTPTNGNTSNAGGNVDVTGNITGNSVQPYWSSIRFNSSLGANQSVSISGKSTTLTLPDILVTPNVGACNVTFTPGTSFIRPGTGASVPLAIWQNNTAGILNLNAILQNSSSGNTAYVQAGPGTVSIASAGNTYSGQSYLNGGVTLITNDAAIGPAASAAAVNLNGGTLMAANTLTLDNGGANPRPINLLANGGGLAVTAGNTFTVDGVVGSAVNTGPLTIGIPASSANNFVAGLLPGTGAGTANTTPVYAAGTVVLTNANYYTGGTILQSGTLNINGIYVLGGGNYGGLTFNGGTLQYSTNFTGNNGSADLTSTGTAGITLAAGGGTIDVNGNSVTYAGFIGNNGGGALTIKSSTTNGTLALLGANTYAGNTTVTNATLLANNSSGSATGSGNVTVQNGGILAGMGGMDGSVTVLAGGTLAPGNPISSLGIGNNLILAAGSKTLLQVRHSPPTNDALEIAGAFTAGGTLIVTNSGGTAFTAGDSFNLFTAANYSGSFAAIMLPPLNPGLFWSTSQLAANGMIGVASSRPPAISSVGLAGGNLILQGTGGTPGWNYYILTSTNLTLPLAQWMTTATNYFDASGNFTWTNTTSPTGSEEFYLIKVQ